MGHTTNLRRATFVVLDASDGLQDQGFEQQIMLILKHIRPNRQVYLFSVTWPANIERLAKDVCSFKPIQSLSEMRNLLRELSPTLGD